jgi:FkbM family methyltransferase
MLSTEYVVNSPFRLKRLPWLARFYCQAYHQPSTLWRTRARRVLFSLFHAVCRYSQGEFEYERFGRRASVRFNARNVQFQTLYAPECRNGYEPEVALLLDLLLPEGGTLFDIGSNWGYFTLYAASRRAKLRVHAFEPLPQSYADLTACVQQAGLSEVVTCHRVALSNSDGQAFIGVADGLHTGGAQLCAPDAGQAVPLRRLDGMQLPPPDLIKMDVEDHELEVLRGGVETLKSSRPFLVFESIPNLVQPQRALEPLFYLAELGYRLYAPALQRRAGNRLYYRQDYSEPPASGDLLLLLELSPQDRLLWPRNLNLFACHEELVPQLATKFTVAESAPGPRVPVVIH